MGDKDEISIVLFNMAEVHERGYGTESALKKAKELYEESAAYGLEEANKKLDNLKI